MNKLMEHLNPMKMWNRFVEFSWHPSIQWERMPQPKYRPYRYPSPGSFSQKELKHNYKTAYKDSIHDIRYTKEDIFYQNNGFKYSLGRSIDDDKPVIDELKIMNKKDLKNENREQMQELIRSSFQEIKDRNAYEQAVYSLDETYNPEFLILKSYDLCADHPSLRQLKLDMDYYIEGYSNQRVKQGKYEVMKGDVNLWQILDNSFQPQQIQQLQGSIRDYQTNTEIDFLSKQHNSNEPHKKTYLKFPIESKFVEQ